jgi:uncharacterized pyridoxamine 5'-phosphate oxidase family protein
LSEKCFRSSKILTFATLNDEEPSARIIDVMFIERDLLYFSTARGKSFYRQLKTNPSVAMYGMNEKFVPVRVVGDVKFCGALMLCG